MKSRGRKVERGFLAPLRACGAGALSSPLVVEVEAKLASGSTLLPLWLCLVLMVRAWQLNLHLLKAPAVAANNPHPL